MATDEFPCQSIDNNYRGLLRAHQTDDMEWPPCPECGGDHTGGCTTGYRWDIGYCRHGVYVGDPCGPDYMCGRCESGDD